MASQGRSVASLEEEKTHQSALSWAHCATTRRYLMAIKGGTFKMKTGYEIPYFGLGLFQIRDARVLKEVVDAALSVGYRLFDTATVYANEKELGDALVDGLRKYSLKREDVFITTKMQMNLDDNKAYVREQVTESLEKLRTSYLDLVLIHYPRPYFIHPPGSNTDPSNKFYRRDTYDELLKLQEEGKIRTVGVSNFEICHLRELTEEFGLPMPAVNQLQFHPHLQRRELKKYCEKEGIFFQAFTSLGRNDPRLLTDPKVVQVAQKQGVTVPQVLLAYGLQHRAGVLPKSATPSRVINNFKALDLHLSDKDMTLLDSAENGNSYSPTEGWNVL